MNIQGSIEEARPRTARSVALNGGLGRFLDRRMIGQSKVVVRAEHNDLLAIEGDHGILGRRNAPVIRIQARCADFLMDLVVRTFLENVHDVSSRVSFGISAGGLLGGILAPPTLTYSPPSGWLGALATWRWVCSKWRLT